MKRNHYLLIIAIIALISLSAYYYIAVQIPAETMALEMRGTIEAMRAGQ